MLNKLFLEKLNYQSIFVKLSPHDDGYYRDSW